MKRIGKLSFILTIFLLILLAVPETVSAQPVHLPLSQEGTDGKVVLGGFYRLESGETLNGGLVIFGGQGVLEEDSTVNGDILIVGGTLDVDGDVNGDVVAVGGSVRLDDNAVIKGDLTTIGAAISQAEGAVVEGSLSFEVPGDVTLDQPDILPVPQTWFNPTQIISNLWQGTQPIRDIFWKGFQALALAALAAILMLFLQKPTERVAKTLTLQPILSGGLGLLTIIVAPALFLLLMITIILIPLGIIGLIAIGLALLFGWIAIGYEVGNRLEKLFDTTWVPAIKAGLGTLALTILSNVINWIPCLGFTISTLVAIIGLGGVVLSRFGTQVYATKKPAPKQQAAPRKVAEVEPPSVSEDSSSGEQNLLAAIQFDEEEPELEESEDIEDED